MAGPHTWSPLLAVTLALAAGCITTPEIAGLTPSPAPNVPWVLRATDAAVAGRSGPDPGDRPLTLGELVDYGLRNNSATRIAWANAQSAAASYGSARGAYLPTIDGQVAVARVKTAATQGRVAVEQNVFTPGLTLSYLLFDFGGRGGHVAAARLQAMAAALSHNAAIQDVVLQIEVAYFQYLANRALLEAQRTTMTEAAANLNAAQERRTAGVATIADVLQARTALSQARLTYETTDGNVQTSRGSLAQAVGLPANASYQVDGSAAQRPVASVADGVDALIAAAVRDRPDLRSSRATAEAAQARVTETRARLLPSVTVAANLGLTYSGAIPRGADTYNAAVALNVPLFAGLSRRYDLRASRFAAEAAAGQAETVRQQVIFQVFSDYYTLQTATRRVASAEDLLASARQSSEVALGRYKAGVGTVLDLLAAQSALADARAQQVQARLSWSVSLAQLAHDAGLLDVDGGSPLRLVAPRGSGSEP
jgi:outer membrane protein